MREMATGGGIKYCNPVNQQFIEPRNLILLALSQYFILLNQRAIMKPLVYIFQKVGKKNLCVKASSKSGI